MYFNKITMIKEKALDCYFSLTLKDFAVADAGSPPPPFEYGWRGYDPAISTKTEMQIDVWPGLPKNENGAKVKEEVLSWPPVLNSLETECPLYECVLFDKDCASPPSNPTKFSIDTVSPWKVNVQRDDFDGFSTDLCVQCTNKLDGDIHVQQTLDWIFTYDMYGGCSKTIWDKDPPPSFTIDYSSAGTFEDFKVPLNIHQFQTENTENNNCGIQQCDLFPEYEQITQTSPPNKNQCGLDIVEHGPFKTSFTYPEKPVIPVPTKDPIILPTSAFAAYETMLGYDDYMKFVDKK